MSVYNSIVPQEDQLQLSPEAFSSLKIDFSEAVKKADTTNFKEALAIGFKYLESQADKHDLYKLKTLFNNYKDKDDLCSNIQSYLATNVKFNYYRYPGQKESRFTEDFKTDLNRYEVRNLLILIRCYEISKGVVSTASKERINQEKDLQAYIVREKAHKSLYKLYAENPEIKKDRIKNYYYYKRKISDRSELNRIIRANLYILTYDHKRFTSTEKDGRVFNALTSLNRIYRANEFAFQLNEFDIKSANAQIIDKLFNFNRYKGVYENLMHKRDIGRDKAKQLFNATLNNHRLSRSQAENIYLQAGYNASEVKKISRITANAKKGSFYRFMSEKETEIINGFIGANFNRKNVIRLHDSIHYEPEFETLEQPIFNGVDYSQELTSKANIFLDLKLNTNSIVLTAPGLTDFVRKQYFNKAKARLIYKGKHFAFYDRDFRVLSANFNINTPVYEDKEQRTPTELEFIERIKELYKTILYLNRNSNFERIFTDCIEAIAIQEGISFNKNYIYTIMKDWNFSPDDALQYVKQRNWTYFGGKRSRYKFQSLYYEELAECKQSEDNKRLKVDIEKLIKGLKKGEIYHIDPIKYKRSRSTNTHELIRGIYQLIGIKKVAGFEGYKKVVQEITHPKGDSSLGCVKNYTTKNKLAKKLHINRRFLNQILYVLENTTTIIHRLEAALINLDDFPEIDTLFVEQPSKKTKPVTSDQAFKEVPYQNALVEWNKLDKYKKQIFLNRKSAGYNGFFTWYEEHYTSYAN